MFSRQNSAMYSRLAFSLCPSAWAGLLPSATVQRSLSFKDGFAGCRFQGWCLLSRELVPLPLCWITGMCCFMWFFSVPKDNRSLWVWICRLAFQSILGVLSSFKFPACPGLSIRRVINLLNRIIINSPSVSAWSASQWLCFLSETDLLAYQQLLLWKPVTLHWVRGTEGVINALAGSEHVLRLAPAVDARTLTFLRGAHSDALLFLGSFNDFFSDSVSLSALPSHVASLC